MRTECKDCERRNGDCGGHWSRAVRPRYQTTRSKIDLDVIDHQFPDFSAYDRDAWDPQGN